MMKSLKRKRRDRTFRVTLVIFVLQLIVYHTNGSSDASADFIYKSNTEETVADSVAPSKSRSPIDEDEPERSLGGHLRQKSSVKHVPFEVDTREDKIEEGVRHILVSIKDSVSFLQDTLTKKTKPISGTEIKRLTIATSNKSFKCSYVLSTESECAITQKSQSDEEILINQTANQNDTSLEDKDGKDYIIIRVYGKNSDLLVDRQHELNMIETFSNHGVGSRLFATFDNGYASHYAKGRMLEVDELHSPFFFSKIAAKLAQTHKILPPFHSSSKGAVWRMIYKWLNVAIALHNTTSFDYIKKEIKLVESALSKYNRIVLTHNDLNHGNIIYNPNSNELTLVDFEAADYSDRGFDLGNHFCEWAGLDLDFSKYPNKEQQFEFLRYYISEQDSITPDQVSEEQLKELYAEANQYALVSHLMWHIWARIQSRISDIPYFNYEIYGQKRLEEYYRKRDEFLSL